MSSAPPGAGADGRPRRCLILAATTAYQQDDLVAAARRLGVEPVLATDRCHILAELWPAASLALDFRSPEHAAEQVLAEAARTGLDGVVATDEGTAVIAALVAERLGLPHAAPDAARAAGDKHRFRQAQRAAGLPQPGFARVMPGEDPRPVAEALGYPVVVKPLHLSASRGVMRADDPEQLVVRAGRLARLLADPAVAARAPDPDAAAAYLIESFVPGPELAFEGLLSRGRLHRGAPNANSDDPAVPSRMSSRGPVGHLHRLALFDKPDPLDGPTFAETIYVTPSSQPEAVQEAIAGQVAAAAAAIGLDEGPVHAELRLPPGAAPVVLELAARSIGGLCGRVLRFGAGVSLEEVTIAHAVGLDPGSLGRTGEPAGGVLMLPVEQSGVLRAIDGVEQARQVEGVRDVVITARPGDVMTPLPEGRSYAGFVFAGGAEPAAVTRALRAARARLRIHTSPRLGS